MSLEQVLKEIEKKHPGKVRKGSEAPGLEVRRIPTGSLALDIETGGGWIQGSINEIYGPYSSGKSFILYKTIAENQRLYPEANFALLLFEDLDEERVETCGVNLERLHIIRPTFMEDGLDIAEALIKSKDLFFIGIDSWGAMCPKAEFESSMEDYQVGLRARLANKWVRKIAGTNDDITSETLDLGNTTLLIINQVYSAIGTYGNPERPPSNKAIDFFGRLLVSVRRDYSDGNFEKDSKTGATIWQTCQFTIDKNKTKPPRNKGHFRFNLVDNKLGKAGDIQLGEEVITYGVSSGVINQSGAWFTLPEAFGGERFQGKPNLIEWINENQQYHEPLKELILKEYLHKE